MNKSLRNNIILFAFVAITGLLINSCGEDTVNNPNNPPSANPCGDTTCIDTPYSNNTIYGKVCFVDTNFIRTGGTYLISAYPESGWPPMGPPSSYDTIRIAGNKLSYCYKLVGLNSGNYVVSVGFRKFSGGQSPIMGIYGCDTARFPASNCLLSPTLKAQIINEAGVGNIDFLSWADTTYKIF